MPDLAGLCLVFTDIAKSYHTDFNAHHNYGIQLGACVDLRMISLCSSPNYGPSHMRESQPRNLRHLCWRRERGHAANAEVMADKLSREKKQLGKMKFLMPADRIRRHFEPIHDVASRRSIRTARHAGTCVDQSRVTVKKSPKWLSVMTAKLAALAFLQLCQRRARLCNSRNIERP